MNVVVPLAGPDFIHPKFGVRPLLPIDGKPLVQAALDSRPWMRPGQVTGADITFVFRDTPETDRVSEVLASLYPGCRSVRVSSPTAGALFSALTGAALIRDDRPLCIDLVDILYSWSGWSPADQWADGWGGAAPVFTSDDPAYSYLEFSGGTVVRAAEKQVISSHASAGTYFFRDIGVFLAAASHSWRERATLAYKDVLFVCPALNGVLDQGLTVLAPAVEDVRPIGKMFH